MKTSIIYQADKLPELQNKVFSSEEDAVNFTVDNIVLVQNKKTGIVENSAFDPNLIMVLTS